MIQEDDVRDDLKATLDKLLTEGLLKMVDVPRTNDIKSIIQKDEGCQFAWIEITQRCNLKCKHCYNESDAFKLYSMSLDQYMNVVDILENMGITKVQIIGGEPFWNPELLKSMLDYTIKKFEYFEIFTNGTLVANEWFDYLSKNNIRVALSVYSYDKNFHDGVTTVNGSWEKTNDTIKKLKEKDIPYRVCNVLMDGVELGNKNTELYHLNPQKDIVRMSGRGNFNLLSEELLRKKLITKDSFKKPIKKAFCSRLISGHNCFRNKIYVSADLKVYPCVMERRMEHASITSDGMLKLNDNIRFMTKDYIEGCKDCEYRYACYDCRPDSLNDNVYEKPWYCTYEPTDGVWKNVDLFIADLKENI